MPEWGWTLAPLLIGFLDVRANHCVTDCFARNDIAPRTHLSAGALVFEDEVIGEEIYLRHDLGRRYGPVGFAVGVSATTEGSVWAGLGATYTLELPPEGIYAQFHFMPGLQHQGDSLDIGGPVAARAGVELGVEMENGMRVSLSLDHRSHGGIHDENPGVETVQFRVSLPHW